MVNVAGWDPSGVDGADWLAGQSFTQVDALALEPATPLAAYFVTNIWPHYDRLFRAGVKQAGTEVGFNHFLAVQCKLLTAVNRLIDIQTMFTLAEADFGREWERLQNTFGRANKLYVKSLLKRYENLVKTLVSMPAIRGLFNENARMRAHFSPVGSRGSLTVTLERYDVPILNNADSPSNMVENWLTEVDDITNELRSDYADVVASMRRYMPYTLGDSAYVMLPGISVDPFKTDGLINSDFTYNNVSGNEGDETTVNSIFLNQDASEFGFTSTEISQDVATGDTLANKLHTVIPGGIPAMSLWSSSVWMFDNDALDKEFALFTPHMWGAAFIYTRTSAYNLTRIDFTGGNMAGMTHLAGPLSVQVMNVDGTDVYSPIGTPTTIDIDAALTAFYPMIEEAFDVRVIRNIDGLAQTSSNPVVHPAVHAARM
jgi:hypothetical protein